MPYTISLNTKNRYEIKICGQLDDSCLEWFGEAKPTAKTMTGECQVTMFSDVVMDQAGLVGLIRRLHSIGIVLISIRLELQGKTK